MAAKRHERLSGIVQNIGAIAFDDSHWTVLLDELAVAFRAKGVSFEIIETRSQQPILMKCSSELGETPKREYLEYYGRISPRIAHCSGKAAGSVSWDHMFFSDQEIDRDEFYSDCMAPQGLRYFIAGHVYQSPSHEAVVSVHRSPEQGHVGEEEVRLMNRLLPDLQKAVDLKFRIAVVEAKTGIGIESLDRLDHACIVVDQSCNVLHLNAAAEDMLSNRDGIGTNRGRLTFDDQEALRGFSRALDGLSHENDRNSHPHDFPVARPSGKRSYVVSIRALPPQNPFARVVFPVAALVFIRDPDRRVRVSTSLLQHCFDLTSTQASVAAAFDSGLSLSEIAANRDISIATARSHLYALMQKMNVRTQSELARVLVQYRSPFS